MGLTKRNPPIRINKAFPSFHFMGVNIAGIVNFRNLKEEELKGKKIAADTFAIQLHQVIRTMPLLINKGNITTHLSGLFYRTTRLDWKSAQSRALCWMDLFYCQMKAAISRNAERTSKQ